MVQFEEGYPQHLASHYWVQLIPHIHCDPDDLREVMYYHLLRCLPKKMTPSDSWEVSALYAEHYLSIITGKLVEQPH